MMFDVYLCEYLDLVGVEICEVLLGNFCCCIGYEGMVWVVVKLWLFNV